MTVSMGAVKSAGGAASYFAKDNYYTAEQAELSSQWGGEGAKEAGLSGAVDQERFEAILNGELPEGIQVGDPANRANGSDFTFSAPKSVSLLAYLSGDKRLLVANMEAVKATMAWAEKNLAETRVTVDGKVVPIRTGNLVYALFPHDTSRSLDPQAHIHAVIANLTRLPEKYRQPDKTMPDGTVVKDHGWRSLAERPLWLANTTLGSIYHAALRERVEALGYDTKLTGKHGVFEISGVAQIAIDAFSKRRQDIMAKAGELGVKSRDALLAITLRSRNPKLDSGDRDVMVADWQEEGRAVGYNGDAVMARALERAGDKAIRGPTAVRDAIADAIGRFAQVLRGGTADPLVDQGLAKLTRTPETARTQYATASAIRILGEREAAFKTSAIVKTALDLGLKGVTVDRVEARIEQLTERGELVREQSQRYDKAIDVVTTRDAITKETQILAGMDAGKGAARPLMRADFAAERLQALAGDRQLNTQQLAAAIQIVSSADRVVLVQGRAGAGKSTMLQPIARAEALDATAQLLKGEGREPMLLTADTKGNAVALAFQNKMVADLKDSTGLEAMTVHSFIARNEPLLERGASRTALAERRSELSGRYVILDEASMISNAQMASLVKIANGMELGRLAIVGDRRQLNPIESGKSFAVMQAHALNTDTGVSSVNINMRQTNDAMRLVADLADAGMVRAAVEALGDRVIESQDRIGDAANAWLALSAQDRQKTTLLPSSRDGRARANTMIQEGLKAEGSLQGDGRSLNVRESVSTTHEELRYVRTWMDAEILQVAHAKNGLGLAPGDYQIERVYANGRIGLTDEKGRKHRIDPQKIDPLARNDGLSLTREKEIRLHEGEKIRWTANDKKRDMLNATIAQVTRVTGEAITVKLANGQERVLANGDTMLKRVDLAYAINTHMAQGITNERVFSVMGSRETNLSNARSFLVNHTRQQSDVRLFTDDAAKLVRQLEGNRGDKTSALETIGRLNVERTLDANGQPMPQSSMRTGTTTSAETRTDRQDVLNSLRNQNTEPSQSTSVRTDITGTGDPSLGRRVISSLRDAMIAGRAATAGLGDRASASSPTPATPAPTSTPAPTLTPTPTPAAAPPKEVTKSQPELDRSKGLDL